MENKPMMGETQENKLLAAISYLLIVSLIMLLVKKDSKFIQFHAKQGLVVFILAVICWFVIWIPVFGWLLNLGVIVLIVVGFIKAYSGEYWKMPIVSTFAEKINF